MINVSKFWSKKQYNQIIRSLFPNKNNLCNRFLKLKTKTRVKMKQKKNKKRMKFLNIVSQYKQQIW